MDGGKRLVDELLRSRKARNIRQKQDPGRERLEHV
jgi:hypothetical protein